MGARLVSEAVALAVDVPLNPNEFRLLVGMCLTALDEDKPGRPARRYFASRQESAYYLGRRITDRPTSAEERRARDAALEAVKVAARGLVALNVITLPDGPGRKGHRANYFLGLDLSVVRITDEFRKRRLSLLHSEGRAFPKSKVQPSESRRLALPLMRTEEPAGTTGGRTSPQATISRALDQRVAS